MIREDDGHGAYMDERDDARRDAIESITREAEHGDRGAAAFLRDRQHRLTH